MKKTNLMNLRGKKVQISKAESLMLHQSEQFSLGEQIGV